jgi:hypothetical protein
MPENHPTLAQRIAAAGITIASEQVPAPEDGEWSKLPGSTHWTVTLTNPATGETITTEYHMGSLLTGEPEAQDVLGSLVSDAAGYDCADSFEDWATEYSYDTDSRAAEADYHATGGRAAALAVFLGEDFSAFLYETEGQ